MRPELSSFFGLLFRVREPPSMFAKSADLLELPREKFHLCAHKIYQNARINVGGDLSRNGNPILPFNMS